MKDFIDFAKERKSSFEYSDKKVSDEDLIKILDAGRWAPSCTNSQPWHFIVIRDKAQIKKVMETANYGFFHEYPPLIVAIVLLHEKCVGENYACFRGIDSAVHDTFMSIGCAALNMCYEAQDLGINSAIVTPDQNTIKKILKINKGDAVPLFVSIGYEPKNAYKRKRVRNEINKITSYEYFGGKK